MISFFLRLGISPNIVWRAFTQSTSELSTCAREGGLCRKKTLFQQKTLRQHRRNDDHHQWIIHFLHHKADLLLLLPTNNLDTVTMKSFQAVILAAIVAISTAAINEPVASPAAAIERELAEYDSQLGTDVTGTPTSNPVRSMVSLFNEWWWCKYSCLGVSAPNDWSSIGSGFSSLLWYYVVHMSLLLPTVN